MFLLFTGSIGKMITLSKKLKQQSTAPPVKKEEENKRISVRDKLLVKGMYMYILSP